MQLVRPPLVEYRTWVLDSRRWFSYKPAATDIVIATAPKCGTTWMQQIVSSLVFGDDHVRTLDKVCPWVDRRFHEQTEVFVKRNDAPRRMLKSHLPFDGLPLYDEVRYIHVARDGRDAFLSMHNHFRGFRPESLAQLDAIGLADPAIAEPYPRISSDPKDYWRQWLTTPVVPGQGEGLPHPSFFDLEKSFWAERRRANVLLVHYADLKADLEAEMRRVANFLDIEIDETVWPRLVGAASFDAMRANADALNPMAKAVLVDGNDRFFHRGVSGRWVEHLGADDLALYKAKTREKFTPGLARWIEGGRALAGEPRECDD